MYVRWHLAPEKVMCIAFNVNLNSTYRVVVPEHQMVHAESYTQVEHADTQCSPSLQSLSHLEKNKKRNMSMSLSIQMQESKAKPSFPIANTP